MTIREYLEGKLVERGLFEDQAHEVMNRVIAEDANSKTGPIMGNRWQDVAEGYPPQLFAVLWISVKQHTLAWIDESKPHAWYRPLFAE